MTHFFFVCVFLLHTKNSFSGNVHINIGVVITVFFVFVSLTFRHHTAAEQRLEAVEMGNGAVVQVFL